MRNSNRYALSNQVLTGSITNIMNVEGVSQAEALLDVEIVVIVDTSGSMSMTDRGEATRYERAVNELKDIQEKNPGKVLVVSFSDSAEVCLNGVPTYLGGSTYVARGLSRAREYDMSGIQFILICDGHPDDGPQAIAEARLFSQKIHTIFIGREDDREAQEFLKKISGANSAGGVSQKDVGIKLLGQQVNNLLLTSGK